MAQLQASTVGLKLIVYDTKPVQQVPVVVTDFTLVIPIV
jgi:hypothetical protein